MRLKTRKKLNKLRVLSSQRENLTNSQNRDSSKRPINCNFAEWIELPELLKWKKKCHLFSQKRIHNFSYLLVEDASHLKRVMKVVKLLTYRVHQMKKGKIKRSL